MCQIVSELGMGISPSPRDFSRFRCGCQILQGPALVQVLIVDLIVDLSLTPPWQRLTEMPS